MILRDPPDDEVNVGSECAVRTQSMSIPGVYPLDEAHLLKEVGVW